MNEFSLRPPYLVASHAFRHVRLHLQDLAYLPVLLPESSTLGKHTAVPSLAKFSIPWTVFTSEQYIAISASSIDLISSEIPL